MRVWLVTIGEPLPTDPGTPRLLRAGILATMLVQQGHEVLWWTSTFDHTNKRQRAKTNLRVVLDNGVDIRMIHGCGYRRNVSIFRILNHMVVANRFAHAAKVEQKPDIIVCSLPTLELSVESVRYGQHAGVPVIIDVRDLWPDLFEQLVPEWAGKILHLFLYPMRQQARQACKLASGITGNSPYFVDWGVDLAGRQKTKHDCYYPHGYITSIPSPTQEQQAKEFWKKSSFLFDEEIFTACFFGAIGPQSEFETVIDAARILEKKNLPFRFVLCGLGDRLQDLKNKAADCSSVHFPGWIDAPEILGLMRISHIGLVLYRSNIGYVRNIPNKPIEYLSAGLPIVSTLQGYLSEFLEKHDCGITCGNGDAAGLARALTVLAEDRDRLKRMSDNARKVFAERFEAEKVYSKMIGYLEDVVHSYQAGQAAGCQPIIQP